ncbi:MDR family MFS transporter [Alkalihalobacterium alkalinitrilicum]|uniref:MDR family MFS transporter n=1 Tax=Alkalihalobacterium alkalinitrilicum TaxID=427920 RepID=UPI0009956F2A|nr:MFS transporter [Alkalihalobacterium alkalinitrilicum]
MPKAIWLLVIGMVINVTGASFIWPLNTIYLHQELGQSLSVAGIVLMMNAGAGVIGNLIGGALFDRIGGYKTIIYGIAITIISAFVLAYNHTFLWYVALLVGIGFGAGMTFPALYAMAGTAWPEGGRKAFNAMYVAQNVGVALGTALAGVVASIKMDYIFISNGIVYCLFLLLAVIGFRKIEAEKSISQATSNVFEQKRHFSLSRPFIALLIVLIGYFICWVAYVQWQSNISVYTQQLGISLTQYSVLWTINGAMIVLCQPIIAFIVRKWVHTLKSQIYTGLVIFIFSFFVLSQAQVFSMFIAAMVILTIGEMFIWPAIPTIAHKLAPEGKAGFYQGVVNSVATGGRMVGPFIGGLIAEAFGMVTLFYAIMILFFVAFVSTALYDRVLKQPKSVQEHATNQTFQP